MERILLNLLEMNINEFDNLHNKIDIVSLKKYVLSKRLGFKTKYLYNSYFHGLHHSEKVMLFTILIATYYKLDETLLTIVTDAAIYHDIGRENDNEDNFHGFISSIKIDAFIEFENPIYKNPTNIGYLKAIIDNHSRSLKNAKQLTFEYHKEQYSEINYEIFSLLSDILKDADALDRFRFRQSQEISLKAEYLRLDFSHELIAVAKEVNNIYLKNILDIKYKEISNKYTSKETDKKINCYHGIGNNFFKIFPIVRNGILSKYKLLKEGINNQKNFNGANGDFWISVVTPEKMGNASQKYIDNGIHFSAEAIVQLMDDNLSNKCNAIFEGKPTESDYNDERFVFDHIEPTDIKYLIIPKQIFNSSLDNLQYVSCSREYEIIVEIIDYYKKELAEWCNYFPDLNDVNNLLKKYGDVIIKFERQTDDIKKQLREQLKEELDTLVSELNNIIQNWMLTAFRGKLAKDSNSKVTLNEILPYFIDANQLINKDKVILIPIQREIYNNNCNLKSI